MSREWRSKRVVARDRRETRRLVVLTSVSVVILSALTLLVLPAGWRHPSSATPASSAASPSLVPPRVTIAQGTVSVDGVVVARTEGLEEGRRIQRIDGLYDAMHRRHFDELYADGAATRAVDLEVAADVPAIVVKSAVQTLAFAGYDDVRLMLVDGGRATL